MPKNDIYWPRISILIPSFNKGQYIERTLVSILNQKYPSTEIIVMDGGSTDSTIEVLKKYEKFITYWVSESDGGQAHALNKALTRATGDIIGWQNSDDIYLPNAFFQIFRVFRQRPDIAVCYGNWVSIDKHDRVISPHYALKPRIPHASFENMDAYNQTMFWRRWVFTKCGGFDMNLPNLIDTDFIANCLLTLGKERFYKIDSFLGAFRWHDSQKTDFFTMTSRQREEEMFLEKKYGFLPKSSLAGCYYRILYRLAQFFESFRYGGPRYTLEKATHSYRRRGRFI